MNVLIERLPREISINGQAFAVDADFRTCLRIILAFEDPELTGSEKASVLLANLYEDKPEDVEAAVEAGVTFLNGGKAVESEDVGDFTGRLYSFNQDAPYIYSAFRQTHGIDLESVEFLHWWKFLYLFMDLGNETTFCNLVSLRKRVKTGKASKEELAAYREMRDLVEIEEPDTRTDEEKAKADEFMKLVEEGRKKRENRQD